MLKPKTFSQNWVILCLKQEQFYQRYISLCILKQIYQNYVDCMLQTRTNLSELGEFILKTKNGHVTQLCGFMLKEEQRYENDLHVCITQEQIH